MKVRFLADGDLKKAIVSGVLRREPSLDFLRLTSRDAANIVGDEDRLPAHFRSFRGAGKHSAGVFLMPQSLDVGTATDELLLIWLASEAAEWLEWLPL